MEKGVVISVLNAIKEGLKEVYIQSSRGDPVKVSTERLNVESSILIIGEIEGIPLVTMVKKSQQAREIKKTKECYLSPNISEHDLSYRINWINKTIKANYQVKVFLMPKKQAHKKIFKRFESSEINQMTSKLIENIKAGLLEEAKIQYISKGMTISI